MASDDPPIAVTPTATDWIGLVLAHAAQLRAVGVHRLDAQCCSVTLLPLPQGGESPAPTNQAPPFEEPLDHWHDPASYPGGIVPGFAISKLESER